MGIILAGFAQLKGGYSMNTMCKQCNERVVQVKKYQLCFRCYQILRKAGTLPSSVKISPAINQDHMMHQRQFREVAFVKNFFTHPDWVAQPAVFTLCNGETYRPDFYDIRRRIFIEVVGTTQAFYRAKYKYDLFEFTYPDIAFEIRWYTGELNLIGKPSHPYRHPVGRCAPAKARHDTLDNTENVYGDNNHMFVSEAIDALGREVKKEEEE